MTTSAKGRPTSARSQKVRTQSPAADQTRLGSFPPPTEFSEQLAADNLKLACAMASRLARVTKMPFDDLYLAAVIGLLKGCRKYDPEKINPANDKPYKLATCVVPFINGAMAQWLRDRGHSSGVKFPNRWRDKAPTVRRLAASGASLKDVVEATSLEPEEVEQILQAQSSTKFLDPDLHDFASFDHDPLDEAETFDELSEALRIADEAYNSLCQSDQITLEMAWNNPKRRQLARLCHGQFLFKARKIMRLEQQEIYVAPETLNNSEILETAQQLVLIIQADVGKTLLAGLAARGEESGDQPSDKQWGPA